MPMFGRFFTSGQNIPVDRSSRKGSVKAFKIAAKKLANGDSIALFPEGGIKDQVPELGAFKNGAFKLAMEAEVNIVPVLLFDTHKIMESNDLFRTSGRPGKARIKILESISTKQLNSEDLVPLREQIREKMKTELHNYYANQERK